MNIFERLFKPKEEDVDLSRRNIFAQAAGAAVAAPLVAKALTETPKPEVPKIPSDPVHYRPLGFDPFYATAADTYPIQEISVSYVSYQPVRKIRARQP